MAKIMVTLYSQFAPVGWWKQQAGYNELYEGARKPAPIIETACWSHAKRKFYELATLQKAPIAVEAVRRMDELFAIEREINGFAASARLAVRQERSRLIAQDLETWLRQERTRLSSPGESIRARRPYFQRRRMPVRCQQQLV
jgi:transposase